MTFHKKRDGNGYQVCHNHWCICFTLPSSSTKYPSFGTAFLQKTMPGSPVSTTIKYHSPNQAIRVRGRLQNGEPTKIWKHVSVHGRAA